MTEKLPPPAISRNTTIAIQLGLICLFIAVGIFIVWLAHHQHAPFLLVLAAAALIPVVALGRGIVQVLARKNEG